MQKFFDKYNNRLVFIGKKANSNFWDEHWDVDDFRKAVISDFGLSSPRRRVLKLTKKYLHPQDGPILEGGCGRGQNVYVLQKAGFNCIGVDYAKKTVVKINKLIPEIDVRYGDVRKLEFENGYFAGYWSLGVIEHFWDGYDEILLEIKRVLKPGGYLFLTFPYMSPLRILKAKLGLYPSLNNLNKIEILTNFYQFALDHKKVLKDLEKLGFRLKYKKSFGGIKGFKDEITPLKTVFQKLYDYKGKSFLIKALKFLLNEILSIFAGHFILLIFKKDY